MFYFSELLETLKMFLFAVNTHFAKELWQYIFFLPFTFLDN